ncbi:F-box/LRR-repeat protein 2-like [Scleropages formosus]|uniref:F-box/LRR-repeat protein 2-like n=1 Tax=Scleropages formosus TaxID=113540 RepID=UPI000878E06B|nr:F-box/LRR-repeat protein 2-like [Scleropages formosus]
MTEASPNMEVLNIGKIPKLSNQCLIQMMSSFKRLTSLNLAGLFAVRDQTVHHIVKQCPKLLSLTLSFCPHITDVSLIEISTYSPSIRNLDVSGCRAITDRGVQAIAMSCICLQELDLSLTSTGNRGVYLLANYCYRNLHTVKLSFCWVSPDAVRKLCKHCKGLKLLHLYGCCDVYKIKELQEINKNVKVKCDCSDKQET